MSRPLGRGLAVAVVFCAMALACFGRLVAEPDGLIVDADRPALDSVTRLDVPTIGNDATRLFLPHHLWISRSIRQYGRLPLWDDRGFGGRPLVGNPQSGVFYPPVWLFWLFPAPSVLGWLTVGHLVFAALGAYRFSRTLGLSVIGSVFAGLCVQGSPFLLGHVFAGHYPHVWTFAWFPWVFEAIVRGRRGERSGWLATPGLLALCYVAGHPQEWFLLMLGLAWWATTDVASAVQQTGWRSGMRRGLAWTLTLGSGVGLVALELVPVLVLRAWSIPGPGASIALADRYHLRLSHFLQLLSPEALGTPSAYQGPGNFWETQTCVGLVVLFLIVRACVSSPRRALIRAFLLALGLCLVFAMGKSLGVFTLIFRLVPGMDQFRAPARALFLAQIPVAMLAALGLDSFRSRTPRRRPAITSRDWTSRRVAGGAVLRDPGSAAPGSRSTATPATHWNRFQDVIPELFPNASPDASWPIILVVAAAIELAVYSGRLLPVSFPSRFIDQGPIGMTLADSPDAPIRVADTLYDDLRASLAGLRKVNVGDGFQIKHAADLASTLYPIFYEPWDVRGEPLDLALEANRQAERQSVLDRLGVVWIVDHHAPDPEKSPTWQLQASGRWRKSPYSIYRNPGALPRCYVVPLAVRERPEWGWLANLRLNDPRTTVVLDHDPLERISGPRQQFRPARWLSDDPDRPLIEVETDAPGLLVIADTWLPGWSATVDGQPAEVLRGNHAQRVIPLPSAGTHRVELQFRTPGLDLGFTISCATFLLWAATAIHLCRSEKSALGVEPTSKALS